jgi:two-component system chemotaxis response regulator CheB
MKILVVDDSPSVVGMLTSFFLRVPAVESVITARNAEEAIEKALATKPDIITLDIEMPGKSGLQVLPVLQKISDAAIIMCSTSTEHAALNTLLALEKGAFDYIPKSELGKSFSLQMLRERLEQAMAFVTSKRMGLPAHQSFSPVSPHKLPFLNIRCVVLGVSTGGPAALQYLFSHLPVLPVPVLVVQHMPRLFLEPLAKRIRESTRHNVKIATNGENLLPGEVRFAPSEKHVKIRRQLGRIFCELAEEPRNVLYKPSVDVLYQTAAEALGSELLAVTLTGMGKDGHEGAKTVRLRGGTVFAESASSCVVYGMPKAVIESRLASYEFALKDMPSAIAKVVMGRVVATAS